MRRAAKGSGPKCSILLFPRGDQPRATPDLRVHSISHTTSKLACFWALLFQLLVDFGPFWSIFAPSGPFVGSHFTVLFTFAI
jgi:hypothetical protein